MIIETQTHDGARTQFGLCFVKTGKVEKKYGKLFSKLFDYRQKGDYGDLYDYDETYVFFINHFPRASPFPWVSAKANWVGSGSRRCPPTPPGILTYHGGFH